MTSTVFILTIEKTYGRDSEMFKTAVKYNDFIVKVGNYLIEKIEENDN